MSKVLTIFLTFQLIFMTILLVIYLQFFNNFEQSIFIKLSDSINIYFSKHRILFSSQFLNLKLKPLIIRIGLHNFYLKSFLKYFLCYDLQLLLFPFLISWHLRLKIVNVGNKKSSQICEKFCAKIQLPLNTKKKIRKCVEISK